MLSYDGALKLYLETRGFPADKHWRSLLYLATSSEELWDIIWPHIDLEEGAANLLDINLDSLSSGYQILIRAAREFYNWRDSFKISDAADTLDETHWGILSRTISIYRGD